MSKDIKTSKLIWDGFNTNHIKKHGVSIKEVETAVNDKKRVVSVTYKKRLRLYGKSGKRLIVVILSRQGPAKCYVITARDMDAKERKIYRKEL